MNWLPPIFSKYEKLFHRIPWSVVNYLINSFFWNTKNKKIIIYFFFCFLLFIGIMKRMWNLKIQIIKNKNVFLIISDWLEPIQI